jgi:hypothetical protein
VKIAFVVWTAIITTKLVLEVTKAFMTTLQKYKNY